MSESESLEITFKSANVNNELSELATETHVAEICLTIFMDDLRMTQNRLEFHYEIKIKRYGYKRVSHDISIRFSCNDTWDAKRKNAMIQRSVTRTAAIYLFSSTWSKLLSTRDTIIPMMGMCRITVYIEYE